MVLDCLVELFDLGPRSEFIKEGFEATLKILNLPWVKRAPIDG
jgi:hypothetical protein